MLAVAAEALDCDPARAKLERETDPRASWAVAEPMTAYQIPVHPAPAALSAGSGSEGSLSDGDPGVALGSESAQIDLPAPPGRYAGINGLVFYGDRSLFDGDFPGLLLEDFEEGSAAPGAVATCAAPLDSSGDGTCFAAGDILDGLRFQDNPGPDATGLALLGEGFDSNPSKSLVANTFTDRFEIYFTELVFAAGMDLVSVYDPDVVNLTVYGPGGVELGATTTAATEEGSFWGVVSDEPITRIEIYSTSDQAEGVDNLAFGGLPDCGVPWANASPAMGSVPPGGTTDMTVTFDATGLAAGVYTGTLCIANDDPAELLTQVPLTVTVEPFYTIYLPIVVR
jgi:hypothetical protein